MSTNTMPSKLRQPTESTGDSANTLPVTRNLTFAYSLSFLIALLATVAAGTGLALHSIVYPTEEILLSFLPVDIFHLFVGLPVLLGSIWLARRGRLVGLLCWPGAVLYILYSYITNLLGVPFGVLFLPYLFLVVLSVYTTLALVASIDGEAVRQHLAGRVPARATAALLIGLTVLFLFMNISTVLTALMSQPPAEPEHPVFVLIADFTIVIPVCFAGGYLLWRRASLGYVAGAGLLLFYSLLLIGLVPVLLFPAFYDASPVATADVASMLAFGSICLYFFARFMRGSMLVATPAMSSSLD